MANRLRISYAYIEELTDSIIAVKENDRHAHFQNPQRAAIRRIFVDGGLITEGIRADYIISKPAIVDVIVELKGSDTGRAMEQIQATRPIWARHELAGPSVGALIVRGHGVHPKHLASIQRWKDKMRKHDGIVLIVETRNREYGFDEFIWTGKND
jgi:hypothetical protein